MAVSGANLALLLSFVLLVARWCRVRGPLAERGGGGHRGGVRGALSGRTERDPVCGDGVGGAGRSSGRGAGVRWWCAAGLGGRDRVVLGGSVVVAVVGVRAVGGGMSGDRVVGEAVDGGVGSLVAGVVGGGCGGAVGGSGGDAATGDGAVGAGECGGGAGERGGGSVRGSVDRAGVRGGRSGVVVAVARAASWRGLPGGRRRRCCGSLRRGRSCRGRGWRGPRPSSGWTWWCSGRRASGCWRRGC